MRKEDIGYEHEFTEKELSSMSEEMRDAVLEVNEVQIEKKTQDSIFNEKIKTNQDRAIKLAKNIRRGTEERYALCERVVNRQEQVVEWIDAETGSIRKIEPMETGDYQEDLKLPDNQGEDNGGADLSEKVEENTDDSEVTDEKTEEEPVETLDEPEEVVHDAGPIDESTAANETGELPEEEGL